MTKEKNSDARWKRFLVSPINDFIKDSRSVGILLIFCTVVSIFLTNTPFTGEAYSAFWNIPLHSPIAGITLPHSISGFINDALMAIFFLLVGMEIKREMLEGELSSWKQSTLPVFAALGGMLVPAGLYLLWNNGSDFAHGWGVPMATDIAFALGILSLLGKRVPVSLKILLTALAIIDDLGAIVAIALFYSTHISILYLGLAAGILCLLATLNLLKVNSLPLYLILGIGLWYCLFNSGVHATLAGVILAFCLPLAKVNRLEHSLHFPVNFLILPLFALANTAIIFPEDMAPVFTDTITYGVVCGLVLGKPLGIVLFSFLIVRLKLASLPEGLEWKHISGMGFIAGIGFTMSIFISMLAFSVEEARATSKIAVLSASVIAGLLGYVYLRIILKKEKQTEP